MSTPGRPAPARPGPAAPTETTGGTATLAVLVAAGVLYTVLHSLLLPAVPVLTVGLHTDHVGASWVLSSYVLSGGIVTPTVGRLGDIYGERPVLLCLLGVVSIGIGTSALATSTVPMVVGRLIAGSAAGIFPLGFGIIGKSLPPSRVPFAMALMSVSIGSGLGLGALASGVITRYLSFHWLFWFPLIAAGLIAVAAVRWIPPTGSRTGAKVDLPGSVLLSSGLLLLLLAISDASTWGWLSGRTIGVLAAGVLVLAVCIWVERRVRDPLLDIRTLLLPRVGPANLAALALGVGMMGVLSIIPQLAEQPGSSGFGLSASVARSSTYLLPATATMVVFGLLAGYLDRRLGAARTVIFSGLLSALGCVLIVARIRDGPAGLYVGSALIGAGLGAALAALPTIVVRSAPLSQLGVATAVNTIARSVGGAIGIQACAVMIGRPASAAGYGEAFGLCAIAFLVMSGCSGYRHQ